MIIDLLYKPRQKIDSTTPVTTVLLFLVHMKFQYVQNMEWKKSSDSAHFVPTFKKDTAYAVPRMPE